MNADKFEVIYTEAGSEAVRGPFDTSDRAERHASMVCGDADDHCSTIVAYAAGEVVGEKHFKLGAAVRSEGCFLG